MIIGLFDLSPPLRHIREQWTPAPPPGSSVCGGVVLQSALRNQKRPDVYDSLKSAENICKTAAASL